jgi:hypothetical protein
LTLHLQSQVSNPGNLTLHLQSQVSNPEISENDFSRILSLNKHTSAFRIIILILSMVTKRCRKLQSKYVSLTRSVCWDQSINAMQLFFNWNAEHAANRLSIEMGETKQAHHWAAIIRLHYKRLKAVKLSRDGLKDVNLSRGAMKLQSYKGVHMVLWRFCSQVFSIIQR